MGDYRRLDVWRKAHALVLQVYAASGHFPADERFGLVSQIRRAAISIPSNIAEGCGRGGDAEYARFVRIAAGSTNELEYQCLLAQDLGYLQESEAQTLMQACAEVRRMLAGLADALTKHRP